MELVAAQKPDCLYKILSYHDYQVTESRKENVVLSAADDAFIHFSTGEQLDKIISKYWSSSIPFVVLKIEADKLVGQLVYETNPGGLVKYYHLYNGSIPFEAIIESKIIDSLDLVSP